MLLCTVLAGNVTLYDDQIYVLIVFVCDVKCQLAMASVCIHEHECAHTC
jgi:hypothetical protein